LIGRTPLRLYDPRRSTPIILQAGDYLRFVPITREEYDCIRNLEDKNHYEIKIIIE
jgi:allophanate hydrolase subunit 1